MNFIDAAAHGLSHGMLDLGEALFNRVEIGTIGWQEEQPGTRASDRVSHRLAFVAAKVIDDDDVVWAQGHHELGFDISEESICVDRPVDDPGGVNAIMAQRGQKRHGLPMAIGGMADQTRPASAPAAQWRHVGFHPGFIDED